MGRAEGKNDASFEPFVNISVSIELVVSISVVITLVISVLSG